MSALILFTSAGTGLVSYEINQTRKEIRKSLENLQYVEQKLDKEINRQRPQFQQEYEIYLRNLEQTRGSKSESKTGNLEKNLISN